MKISILIPFFNEERTISVILDKIYSELENKHDFEVIAVNDGSTDQFQEKILPFFRRKNFHLIHHHSRMGKGAALLTAYKNSCGEIILIQDADLEYSPNDYANLLEPFISNSVDIVFGYRVHQKKLQSYYLNPFYYGGKLINIYFNFLAQNKIKDIHTCFKLARREIWEKMNLSSSGFEFCHEFASKVIKQRLDFYEVPVTYNPRNKKNGKKIKFSDGLLAIKTINRHLLNFPK